MFRLLSRSKQRCETTLLNCGLSVNPQEVNEKRKNLLEKKLKKFTIEDESDYLHPLNPDALQPEDVLEIEPEVGNA